MGPKSTRISTVFNHSLISLIIYLLATCVGCFGSHDCGGIGTIESLTVRLESCGQLNKTCVINNITGDSTYSLKVEGTFTITNRKNYSDLVYKITAIPSNTSSGVNTILLTQDKAGTFNNNVSYHVVDTLDIPFNFSRFSSTNETWTTQMILASSKNLSEAIICETLPMFDTIAIKAKGYGDICQNPYVDELDECAPLFACRPTTDGNTATCTCIDGQTLEKDRCKKYIGTNCDPKKDECILNAGCTAPIGQDLYSCACKTGYNATDNYRKCTEEKGGGGASGLSSSFLGLLMMTIVSIFPIVVSLL